MSFRFRLIVTIALLIAVTFGIGGTVLIYASFQTVLQEQINAALHGLETVQNTLYLLNSMADQTDYQSMADALEQIESRGMTGLQAIRLKKGNEYIYQSAGGVFEGHLLPSPGTTLSDFQIPQTGISPCSYSVVSDNYGYGIVALSGILAGEEQLILEVRFDVTSVFQARETQQRLFLMIYAVVVVLGALTAAALSFAMTGRLRKLTMTVRQIAGGNLSTRSNLPSQDEFGQLSRDIDAMADKLQENIDRLESEMQRQESFMGAFAHELKTPMTSIIGYADLLRQDGLDDNTRLISANYIFTEAQRLEKLSFKLLDLILLQKDTPQMKAVNLYLFMQEIEKALAPNMSKKQIRFVCRGDRGRAILEPDLVKSLLYNLVDNAAKAMDGEGIIAVKASVIPGGCQFLVVDNGRGMEKEELSKITEAFYRVDKARSRRQGGAGLGLALCRQIVQLHHGTMKFSSTPGAGTRVTVALYGKGGGKDAKT